MGRLVLLTGVIFSFIVAMNIRESIADSFVSF